MALHGIENRRRAISSFSLKRYSSMFLQTQLLKNDLVCYCKANSKLHRKNFHGLFDANERISSIFTQT